LVSAAVSFWSGLPPADTRTAADQASVTLGLPFQSDVHGSVTGVRYLKLKNSGQVHMAQLWSDSGALLAIALFANQTESGWQTARFPWPVAIQPRTRYVVSYFAPNGGYTYTQGFSWPNLDDQNPLRIASPQSGVFAYGMAPLFPEKVFKNTNYWVDVLFEASTFEISGRVQGTPAVLHLSGPVARQVATSVEGLYRISGLRDGVYFVTPFGQGVRFWPGTTMVVIDGKSAPNVNFSGVNKAGFIPHFCSITWRPSSSTGIAGYNLYRAIRSGGPYFRLNVSPVPGTVYVDTEVEAGMTYYYTATAVNIKNKESGNSEEAKVQIPRP
jgi:hypothetical protein